MRKASLQPLSYLCLVLFLSLFCSVAQAQQVASTSLPDGPDVRALSSNDEVTAPDQQRDGQKSSSAASSDHQDGQTKRILGIIPNFRAVNADVKLPPQSIKDKFITASQDSFDYSSLILPGVLAAESQASNATPEFGQGAKGYGRYYWHTFVDQTSENYMVEFIIPAIAHEDTRYYTLGKGGFVKRAEYSLGRVVITRSDSGRSTFNAGEVIGAGVAAGISNLYYPSRERTFGNTASKWGTNVGIDAATFMFKEFWPDINHKFFHAKN
jgi:hypothetical protein